MQAKLNDEQLKAAVKQAYGERVSCCSPPSSLISLEKKKRGLTKMVGYSEATLDRLPKNAVENSFGCGNPLGFAEVKEGDVVLDIGSGAGIDCLIAAEKVGASGRVIGIDFTPTMIGRAQENARAAGATNVEFRLGDAEKMPVEDESVDWVISNCVINLAPNKKAVFEEVYRVLKPGGRVSISDIVLGDDLPPHIASSIEALVGCVAGAIKEADYLKAMREAGLVDVQVTSRLVYDGEQVRAMLAECCSSADVADQATRLFDRSFGEIASKVWSAKIVARKP
jgi:ubiquinone/menaquinone biosynthesis C-methylase UbiE